MRLLYSNCEIMLITILVIPFLFVNCLSHTLPEVEERGVAAQIRPRISTCKCGVKNSVRIVGGKATIPNELPWQAHLNIFLGGYLCGGSVINDRYVATAAHCTKFKNFRHVIVTLGEHNTASTTETNELKIKSTKVINHPNYNGNSLINDIALVKLPYSITFTEAISPICLPTGNFLYVGKWGTASGWGALSSGGKLPKTLRKVNVKILSNRKCKNGYGYNAKAIKGSMMCAVAKNKDACQGDSGGPLAIKNIDGYYVLGGIVSWGRGCADIKYPGVYSRVTSFIPWIMENTSDATYCGQ